MSDLVNWLKNWEARPRYNKALALLNDAHQACFKSPDRDVLGMSHGPFSGVNEALGMFADIEEDFKCAATALALANAKIARLELLLAGVLDDAERDLNSLIECCSTLEFDADGNPRVVPGTLEEDVREEVAARQEMYLAARATLKGDA